MFLRVTARFACIALLVVGLGTACGQQGAGERCDILSGTDNSGNGDCQSGLTCIRGVGQSAGATICCPPAGTSGAPAECGGSTTTQTDAGTETAAPIDTGVTDAGTTDADATSGDTTSNDADAASAAETSTVDADAASDTTSSADADADESGDAATGG